MKKIISLMLCLTTLAFAASCKDEISSSSSVAEGDNENTMEYGDTLLADNGKSDYTVIIPENCGENTEFAANELKTFFYEVTGAVLEVKSDAGLSYSPSAHYFSLDNNNISESAGVTADAAKLTGEGFRIVTKGNTVFMIGGGANGQMYSVYEFLERSFGVKFYAADEILTPKNVSPKIPLFDNEYKPSLQIRSVNSYAFNNSSTFRRRMRVQARQEGWIYTSHSFFAIMPPATYGDHKDWYSPDKTQLCLTNDEMTDQFVKNLYNIYNKPQYKDAVNCMLGMEDSNTFCTCENCLAAAKLYEKSGIMIRFVNKVYKALRAMLDENGQKDRDVKLFMYAYLATIDAPVTDDGQPLDPSLVPDEHVGVMIAPLRAKYDYPLNDDKNVDIKKNIEKWSILFKKNIYMYIYGANYGLYPLMVNDYGSIKNNLSYFEDIGAIGVHILDAYNYVSCDMSHLKNFLQSKLAWDNDLDSEGLIEEFLVNYYKDASGAMSEYVKLWRMQYLENEINYNKYAVVHTSASQTWINKAYWPIEFLNAVEKVFDEAYKSIEHLKQDNAALYGVVEKRIKLESLSYRFFKLELYGGIMPANSVLSQIAAFEEDCAEVGLVYSGERTTTSPAIATYIAKWRAQALQNV